MPWARFEDRFQEHPKVRTAWRASQASIGLHVMAITYCAGNLTDGFVPAAWVESQFRRARDENAAVAALVDAGLWLAVDGGWIVHDYLQYQPTKASVEAKRLRNAHNGRKGGEAKAKRTPGESLANRQAVASDLSKPHTHTRAHTPSLSVSPNGETTDRDVVVVPPPARQSDEIEKACDVLAAAGVHIHDRATVTRLAGECKDVDIVEASIRAANWARDKRVKHPLGVLRQFVEDDDAPRRGVVPQPRGRHLSAVEHYAAMAREVQAEGGDAA